MGGAAPARAELRLAAGANAWLDVGPIFTATVAGDATILPHFQVGARGGAGLLADPTRALIPLDIQARVLIRRAYIEGNVGPWLILEHDPVHAHASLGAGVEVGMLVAGVEVGWLDPQALLGVQPQTLERTGAVSQETVVEMVSGALARYGASVAVAVTGIAGPSGATPGKPVGTVWIGWKRRGGYARSELFHFKGDRESVRRQTVAAALEGVRRILAS